MRLMEALKNALGRRRADDRALRYLEEATSPSDLELRHREIDRGRFRTRWPH